MVLVVWKQTHFGHFFNFFSKFQLKWIWKNPKTINFGVLQIYLVQMNPGDVLLIGRWILLALRKVYFFWKLSQVSVMQLQSKTQNINFWVLQIYLVQINPGDVLVLGKWILLVLEKVWFFRNFHVSVIKLPGKKIKKSIFEFSKES